MNNLGKINYSLEQINEFSANSTDNNKKTDGFISLHYHPQFYSISGDLAAFALNTRSNDLNTIFHLQFSRSRNNIHTIYTSQTDNFSNIFLIKFDKLDTENFIRFIRDVIEKSTKPDVLVIDNINDLCDFNDLDYRLKVAFFNRLSGFASENEIKIFCGMEYYCKPEYIAFTPKWLSAISTELIVYSQTTEQTKNRRVTIYMKNIDEVLPNRKINEEKHSVWFQTDDEINDEALDFIAQQEEINMQRARENAVNNVRKSRKNRPK